MNHSLTFSIGYSDGANVRIDRSKVVSSKRYESRRYSLEEAEATAKRISLAYFSASLKNNFVVSVCNNEACIASYYAGKKLYFNYSSFQMTAVTEEESIRSAHEHNKVCDRMGWHHNKINA